MGRKQWDLSGKERVIQFSSSGNELESSLCLFLKPAPTSREGKSKECVDIIRMLKTDQKKAYS